MRYIAIDTAPHGQLRVGGRLDGIDETSRQVIEIKCRRYKLMGIRDYEKVQLELYLRMTELPRALLIETFEGRRVEHVYLSDDTLWDTIRAGLGDFHGDFLRQAHGGHSRDGAAIALAHMASTPPEPTRPDRTDPPPPDRTATDGGGPPQ